jgi:hypothetical protein
MSLAKTWGVAGAVLGLAACSPALNWREVRPEGSDLVAMYPCKPERFVRQVPLAGSKVDMQLTSCAVDGVSYAVVQARVADPMQVGPALEALREAAAGNIGGQAASVAPFAVGGMTPSPQAVRFSAEGRGADGTPVREQAGVFARGLQVYQATVVGPRLDGPATETFFSGLRFAP